MFPSKCSKFYCKNLITDKINLVFLSVYDVIPFDLHNTVNVTSLRIISSCYIRSMLVSNYWEEEGYKIKDKVK